MLSTVEQLLARLGSGIESTAGVCGGDPRIAGTRIPVWTLEQYRRLGLTEAQILGAFPALRATDLVNAWSFVAGHLDEIDRQIRENDSEDTDFDSLTARVDQALSQVIHLAGQIIRVTRARH